jgi:hypothetical protein
MIRALQGFPYARLSNSIEIDPDSRRHRIDAERATSILLLSHSNSTRNKRLSILINAAVSCNQNAPVCNVSVRASLIAVEIVADFEENRQFWNFTISEIKLAGTCCFLRMSLMTIP